jgi:mycofactocin biosynthesis protein MftB
VSNQIDLDRAWRLDAQVALRPERFGALAYHFGTRRLSFLKDRRLHEVARTLGTRTTAREACLAAGVSAPELPRFAQALASLAAAGMIHPAAGTHRVADMHRAAGMTPPRQGAPA